MMAVLVPIAVAVLTWWFATGAILWLDRRSPAVVKAGLVVSTMLGMAALVGLAASAEHATAAAAYCGFACAIVIWGWLELAFLTGTVTGPRKTALVSGTTGWLRFVHAVEVIAHHELALAAVGLAVIAVGWDAPNPTGAWTFAVLWTMRLSAKLNLFLGVRNAGVEFLPERTRYLASYFATRSVNGLFPIVITVSTAATGWIAHGAFAADATPFDVVAHALASALLALAVLEHWMMVLPAPSTWLWRWSLREHRSEAVRTAAVRTTSA